MSVLKFNVVKEERKALVKAISEIIGLEPRYKGAPGFNFEVGCYTVSPNGAVTWESEQTADSHVNLLAQLTEYGFVYEAEQEEACFGNEGADRLSIDMPIQGMTSNVIANLEKLVASKAWILKKMAGTDSLLIEQTPEQLCFPWFKPDSSAKEIDAYSRLIARLCETAKEKKRIMADEKLPRPGDNEKYKARCFLLALDFKGPEYKQAREILLAPFPGNGSFLQGNNKKKENTPLIDDTALIDYENSTTGVNSTEK